MSSEPKAYEHVEFKFTEPTGFRNGSRFEVTAYLLVPEEVMPELEKWQQNLGKGFRGRALNTRAMYEFIKTKGALLHNIGAAAYLKIEKNSFKPDYSKLVASELWENGVLKTPANDQQQQLSIKSFGNYKPT